MRFFYTVSLVPVFLFGHVSITSAQSCAPSLMNNMQQMADRALQCGESASLMRSLSSGSSGGIGFDTLSEKCHQGVDVSSQLDAFNECSRVYVCAVLAYSYALENLSSYGENCDAAARAGLQQFPVK